MQRYYEIGVDVGKRTGYQYSQEDQALISRLSKLPVDYWDFRDADTRELTHGIHNYPAVMVYPISRNLIRIVKEIKQVDSLLDPFSGSGTVLVEGMVAGLRHVYGNDLNPLAQLISKVKTVLIDPQRLENAYSQLMAAIEYEYTIHANERAGVMEFVEQKKGLIITAKDGWGSHAPGILAEYLSVVNSRLIVPAFKNIGYWYRPEVIIELQIIKDCIRNVPDGDVQNFFWVAFSEIARTVSNRRNSEFKMFRMPAEKILAYHPDTKSEFAAVLGRNIRKMSALCAMCADADAPSTIMISSDDAKRLQSIPDASVDLLITSPPYGDSRTTVAYGEFSKLSLQWLDLDGVEQTNIATIDKRLMGGQKYRNGFEYTLGSQTLKRSLEKIMDSDIERAGDVYSFYKDLDDCLSAIAKKMKLGSYQFWVVGNRTVKLETLKTDVILTELGQKYGLQHITTVARNIPNKIMPSRNSPTNEPGKLVATMTNEHIVALKRIR